MRYLFYIMLLTSVLLSVGCITQFANRSDVVILDERVINLDHRISRLEKQISKIEGEAKEAMQAVEEVGRPVLSGQAHLHARLDAIQADMDELRGGLEQLSHGIAALRLAGIENKIARIETFLGFEAQRVAPQAEVSGEAKELAIFPGEKKVEVQDPKVLYGEAYKLYENGSFVQSREKFKEYLRLFPDTDKSDNAQFWIGECYYSQKRYEEAILEYEKVIRGYPKSNKIPGAFLKQGLAFHELGDKTSSRLLLEKVIEDYPHTNEAKIASRRLGRIR